MDPVALVVRAWAVPALLGGIVFLAARWLARRAGLAGADRVAGALGVGLGYVAGQCAVAWPAFPPWDVTDRLPWVVGLALLLEAAEAWAPCPAWARLENRLLLAAVALGAILGPVLPSWGETDRGQTRLIGLALGWTASYLSLDAQAGRTPALATALGRFEILLGAGLALLLSGSAVLGQLGFALAAAYGTVAALGGRSCLVGGGPILGAGLGALLADGQVYASLPAGSTLALAAAPLAAWVGAVGPLRRGPAWRSALVVVAVTLALVGLAVGLAVAASPSFEG